MINVFEELYALDKAGKVRIFTLSVDKTTEDKYLITTTTRLLGKKPIVNMTPITKGKAKRDVLTQAKLRANSLYEDTRNKGYKTLQELIDYAASKDIDTEGLTVPQLYKKAGIKYNTNTNWRPLPMLANSYKGKVNLPALIQPKLNGVRCIAMFDEGLGDVIFDTRGGKTYNIPHLKAQLYPYLKENQEVILDGEIYYHGKRLQEISGAVRREKDAPDWLEYHIYDIINGEDQETRHIKVFSLVLTLRTQYEAKQIFNVNAQYINNLEEIKEWHDVFVSDGYEGAMVKPLNGLYSPSFRTNSWLKVKEFIDEEFVIIGCKVDPDKTIGESFVFELQNNLNDKTFYARPTGSIAEKETWYSNIDNLIGLKATVRYQERTADGLPHQGHIRADRSKVLTIEEIDPHK